MNTTTKQYVISITKEINEGATDKELEASFPSRAEVFKVVSEINTEPYYSDGRTKRVRDTIDLKVEEIEPNPNGKGEPCIKPSEGTPPYTVDSCYLCRETPIGNSYKCNRCNCEFLVDKNGE